MRENAENADYWFEIKQIKYIDNLLDSQKRQSVVNRRRAELEDSKRKGNINYLNRWEIFRSKREIAIKKYIKALR